MLKKNEEDKKYYTKNRFTKDFNEKASEQYAKFRVNIAQWVIEVQNSHDIYESLKEYILSEFCGIWNIDPNNEALNNFLNREISSDLLSDSEIKLENKFINNDIEIDIATIHSVKGETHIATLYLETSYQKKCESQRILPQMKGTIFARENGNTFDIECLKMAYVGMSRPQYLLCFAVKKENVIHEVDALDMKNGGFWEIINSNLFAF